MIFPNVTNATTGINANFLNAIDISVSPNPSSGLLNISLALENKENVTIVVSNALGQVVSYSKYNSISNDIVSLDLSNQNEGVYFIIVSNGKYKIVKKVVLNK